MNFTQTRLLSQQLVRPRFSDPSEVVGFMGAVQAQEYRLMRWAVAMRTRKPSESAFKAAFDSGEIVRIHLLRGTWHLISREDYPWMMALFSSRARKVIDGWMRANNIFISEQEQESVTEVLMSVAGELHSATKEDFASAVARELGPMDDHRLTYHIRYCELSGVLCNGDLLPMKPSYSLASEKLGIHSNINACSEQRTAALGTLARKYFQSRSPATLDDFMWWSGLSMSDCRKGMAELGPALQEVTRPGDPRIFYILDTCETAARSGKSVLLLPSYDEYLIGYKSRDIVLDPAQSFHAHNNSGIFNPVVAIDGHISGNWSPFSLANEVQLFAGDGTRDFEGARQAFRSFRMR